MATLLKRYEIEGSVNGWHQQQVAAEKNLIRAIMDGNDVSIFQ